MGRIVSVYVPAALFLTAVICIALFPEPVASLEQLVGENGVIGYTVFVSLLIIATVLMPVTVMPMIPMMATVLGPFTTALLSVVGWSVGALIAFCVSRYIGRPILERFFNMEKSDQLSAELPERHRFFAIVLIRLTVPVDIGSYALGLSKSIGIVEYTVATIIGVTWFSFAFAYLGDALLTGNMPILIELAAVSLLIFVAGWYMLRRTKTK